MSNSEAKHSENFDPFESGMTIALLALGPRARSRAELNKYLIERAIPADVAEGVLDQLELQGYLNDLDFAIAWRDSRLRQKRLSRRAISDELVAKGIARDIIAEVLSEIDGDREYELAYQLAERKYRSCLGLPPEKIYGRIASLLARKGFASPVINQVYRQLQSEQESSSS